jgi:hypothetical protein
VSNNLLGGIVSTRSSPDQHGSPISFLDQQTYRLSNLARVLGKEQRLSACDSLAKRVDLPDGMLPGNEVIPFQRVAHTAIYESVDKVDRVGQALHATLANVEMRGVTQPLAKPPENHRHAHNCAA